MALPDSFVSKIGGAKGVFTFRDLILLPGRSRAEPGEIDLSSKLTKNIKLDMPLISSPMDSVTEWRLAVEMARLGGAGVIHRNMPTESQVWQVKKAKASKVDARSCDDRGRPLVGAAVSPLDVERCKALDRVADFLVADVAHFHSSKVIASSKRILPDLSVDFIAGNVGTGKAVADIVDELPRVEGFRAGIGSGSICITSEVTRVGAPTLFAVAEVASAVAERKLDLPVVAISPEDAAEHFTWLSGFLAVDSSASSALTRELLDWQPTHPGLVDDLDQGHYFHKPSA